MIFRQVTIYLVNFSHFVGYWTPSADLARARWPRATGSSCWLSFLVSPLTKVDWARVLLWGKCLVVFGSTVPGILGTYCRRAAFLALQIRRYQKFYIKSLRTPKNHILHIKYLNVYQMNRSPSRSDEGAKTLTKPLAFINGNILPTNPRSSRPRTPPFFPT